MNYEINDKIFSILNDIELDKMGKRAKKLHPEVCLRAFPENDILNRPEAVRYLRSKTSLDENTIDESLDKLVADKKLITARTPNGLYLRKMRKIY
jgi:hypothetical protein